MTIYKKSKQCNIIIMFRIGLSDAPPPFLGSEGTREWCWRRAEVTIKTDGRTEPLSIFSSKKMDLDLNDLYLAIVCFAIQDRVIQITFLLFFHSTIGLDYPDPDTNLSR